MDRSKFQFSDPQLEQIQFLVNQDFDEEKFDGITLNSKTNVKAMENNEAKVSLTITVGNNKEEPFYWLITMSAVFSWDAGMDKELIKQLLRTNAPAALLSYIRPFIANMTMNTQYPAFNLPFLDFTKNQIEK